MILVDANVLVYAYAPSTPLHGSRSPWWAGPEHQTLLAECLQVRGLGANDVPDAHLAALAKEHGLKIATTDAGFARFPDLQWFDPTAG